MGNCFVYGQSGNAGIELNQFYIGNKYGFATNSSVPLYHDQETLIGFNGPGEELGNGTEWSVLYFRIYNAGNGGEDDELAIAIDSPQPIEFDLRGAHFLFTFTWDNAYHSYQIRCTTSGITYAIYIYALWYFDVSKTKFTEG